MQPKYEILPIDPNIEGADDLSKIRQEKKEKALRNLITQKTDVSDFRNNRLPTRPIRGGKRSRYIPSWWFIRQANALFDYLWSFEAISEERLDDRVRVKGQVIIHFPGKTVKEYDPDSGKLIREVSYETSSITKSQFGGAEVKRYTKGEHKGNEISISDDYKSAATDSMKKCLSLFGLAQDVYGPREEFDEEFDEENQKKLDALYNAAGELGYTVEDVIEYCKEKHGIPPDEMGDSYILKVVAEVREWTKKKE